MKTVVDKRRRYTESPRPNTAHGVADVPLMSATMYLRGACMQAHKQYIYNATRRFNRHVHERRLIIFQGHFHQSWGNYYIIFLAYNPKNMAIIK